MHECPECGEVCDCDGDELWRDDDKFDCSHHCQPDDYDDYPDDYDDYPDDYDDYPDDFDDYPDDYDDYPDDFDDPDDDLEDVIANCYMGPGGYCGAAGSEYCDFECPFNR